MDFSDQILQETALLSSATPLDIGLALLLTAVLNGILAKLYMATHGGYSYSKSFVQALILVGITVTLIMVIIGSDIARAFALVGAMSIVRFRTPVKDTKDLVFLFAGIAVGMACGTGFYDFAGIFVGFMIIVVVAMHYWRFGDVRSSGYVLKMRMRPGDRDRIAELCKTMCDRMSVVSVSRMETGDDLEDVVYEVHLKRGVDYDQLVEKLSQAVNPLSVSLLVGEGTVNA
ncbi:MAG: DUF4956 domain-containing protein [Alphaproteobacteria bacterium]|nr:DUF4956 domain-containing protein [Alphaproteobacteria bacterium]